MSAPVPADRSPVQSVDRALEILEYLAAHGEAGVTDLAAHLGVHKSTAFRLVGALEGRGLVEQPGDRTKYRLGMGLLRLAGAVPVPRDVTAVGRRVCEDLAEEFGETVNLAVADAGAVVNIDQVRGGSSIISHNWIGERTPLHATSSGKVLMAFDQELFLAATRRPLTRYTPATLVRPRDLADELAEVRRVGVAFTAEELEQGLSAAAAPVRRQDGTVVAAISVSGPSFRLDQQRLADLGKAVSSGAEEVSRRLGWHPGHRSRP